MCLLLKTDTALLTLRATIFYFFVMRKRNKNEKGLQLIKQLSHLITYSVKKLLILAVHQTP